MNRLTVCGTFLTVVLNLVVSSAIAGSPGKTGSSQGLAKTAANDDYRPILINKVFNYYSNNGDGSYNKYSSNNEGFEKGTERPSCSRMESSGAANKPEH